MKNRILCVLLAVVVGIGAFSSSVLSVSSSAVASFSILSRFCDFLRDRGFLSDVVPWKTEQVLPSMAQYEALTYLRDFCVSSGVEKDVHSIGAFLSELIDGYPLYSGSGLSSNEVLVLSSFVVVLSRYEWTQGTSSRWIYDHWEDTSYGYDSNGNFYFPTHTAREAIDEANKTISPKNRDMSKYSWRALSDYQENYDARYLVRGLGKDDYFLDNKSFSEGVYIYPYLSVGENEHYGDYYWPYQYRLYCDVEYGDPFHDGSGTSYENATYTWYVDGSSYLLLDGEPAYSFTYKVLEYSSSLNSSGRYTTAHFPYLTFGSYSNFYVSLYSNSSDQLFQPGKYSQQNYIIDTTYVSGDKYSLGKEFLKSDNVKEKLHPASVISYLYSGYISSNAVGYGITLSDFKQKSYYDDKTDYGFYVSSEPFTLTYYFDPAKLPDNSTITATGDTFYDYTITDNSTGDTTTINNYYENNYNFPENSGGSGGSSGGGSMSGDVTVGGHIDVGGSVDVNVNVNVSGSGSSGGGVNGNIGDYVGDNSDIDTDFSGYFDLVPQLSKSFIDYMKDFFSWLPKEIYGLIVLGFILLLVRVVFSKR